MVGADLESLISTHNQSSLLVLLMLQKSNIASTTLLPLIRIAGELEQLSTHVEDLLLEFLICLGLNFLCQMNDRLEVNILRFWSFVL